MGWFGLDFEVHTADIDESVLAGEVPQNYTTRLAGEKAWAVAVTRDEEDIILAADTTVAIQPEGESTWKILGKPRDEQEAEVMLRLLRDKTHQVFTGIALTHGQKKSQNSSRPDASIGKVDTTRIHYGLSVSNVTMRPYSEQEMMDYIRSGDPLDKAGAYAVQNRTFHPVDRITGCHTSVVGLPVCLVDTLLRNEGIIPAVNLPDSCRSSQKTICGVYQRFFADN